MTTRKKYSAEFKREAVLQTQHPDVSCNQARELGINTNILVAGNVSSKLDQSLSD